MIQGLKVTITGTELRELCHARAKHHRERMAVYQTQLHSVQELQIEGTHSGNPAKALEEKRAQHEAQAQEMEFIGSHIDTSETYLLDNSDLQKIGVVSSWY